MRFTKKTCVFKKSIETAVPDDGHTPGALVLQKVIAWYRFGVGDEKSFCSFLLFGGWTNICTIWLRRSYAKIARKNATQAARKIGLAAAFRAVANFGRRGCRVFPRNFGRDFGVVFNQIVQRFVHPQNDSFEQFAWCMIITNNWGSAVQL